MTLIRCRNRYRPLIHNDFEKTGVATKTGKFQSHMVVEIVNDGPVTIIIDSKDKISKP